MNIFLLPGTYSAFNLLAIMATAHESDEPHNFSIAFNAFPSSKKFTY